VWDKADQCFKGLLDHRDLCEVLIRLFRTKRRKSFADLLTSDVELATLLEMGLALEAPAELVANVSKKHPLVSVKTSDPLTKLLEHFCSGTHRVFVFDSAGSFLGVLSQSDLIKMLNAHQKELGPVLSRSIKDLGLGTALVVSLEWNHSVIEAIQKMQEHNISSVALVDDAGLLMSVLSMTDIKYVFRAKTLNVLNMSCQDYICSVRRAQSLEDREGKDVYPFFGIQASSPLSHALGRLVATRTHRLFLVGSDSRPLGVISLTDIFRALAA